MKDTITVDGKQFILTTDTPLTIEQKERAIAEIRRQSGCGCGSKMANLGKIYTLQANIISTAITPSVTTCTAPCNMTVDITWTNNGDISGTFIPTITVNGTPTALPEESLDPGSSVTKTFPLTGLVAGSYDICSVPNTFPCATVTVLTPANVISATLTVDKNDCITPCTVNGTISWTNNGGSPGTLDPAILVNTVPTSLGSAVTINAGETLTYTFQLPNLPAGTYQVCASPDTGTTCQTIIVRARGNASFSSNPSGAKIFVDDTDTGLTTPNTVTNLIPGSHTYKLTLTEHYDAAGGFDIASDQTTTVPTVTMELIVGTLSISSTPPGASIYMDNSPTPSGTTPANLILAEGTHTFRLTLAGYYDNIGTVNIVRNQTTALTIGLTQATGDVYITSTPTGAEIFIDNIDQGIATPNAITRLTVGTHTYKLTLAGYLDSTGTFDIVQDQLTRSSVTMVILPGSLVINSTPSEAEIFINGVDQGVTTQPAGTTIPNLAPGTYDIKLTLANYYEYATTVTIATQQTTTLTAELTPMPGNLVIDSIPSGAEIFIAPTGQIPIDTGLVTPNTTTPISLIPGIYDIKLTLANYYELIDTITIGPNQSLTITETLSPLPGSLVISSTPSGAEIFVDGVYKQLITPNTISDVPAGTHTVVLSLANYYDLTETVIVGPNEIVTITKTLTPMPGRFVIDSVPSGAEIFINGVDQGIVTPNTIPNLAPETYDVKLTLANYYEYTATIVIGPNETVTRTETLTPMPGNLTIISTPTGAEIFIAPTGQTPIDTGITTPNPVTGLAPGTYDITLTLAHYNNLPITSIIISPNQGTTLEATLTPKPGFLDITSTPSGAEIFINGVDQGVTTHSIISDLVPGTYNIKLVLADYFDYTTTKTIGPEQGIYLDIELTPMPGSLAITSTPSGASIYIDSRLQIGTTPTTITNLDPITHTIKLTHSEYRNYTADIAIGPNQTVTLNATMILLPGGLIANSIPPGASIYIDSILQTGMVTPSTFALDEGTHTLKLSLVGYYDVEETFDIVHMQTTIISPVLVGATGDVLISSTPPGAKIFIDDIEKIGVTTPITLTRLPAGTHSYRLTLPGYTDTTGTFDIIVGQMITLSTTLTPQVVQAGFGTSGMILIGGLVVGAVIMTTKKYEEKAKEPIL